MFVLFSHTPGIDTSDMNNVSDVHIGLQTYFSAPGHLRGFRVVGLGFSDFPFSPSRRFTINSRLLVSSLGWNELHNLTEWTPMDMRTVFECLASLRVSNLRLQFNLKHAGKLPVQSDDPLFDEELILTLSHKSILTVRSVTSLVLTERNRVGPKAVGCLFNLHIPALMRLCIDRILS